MEENQLLKTNLFLGRHFCFQLLAMLNSPFCHRINQFDDYANLGDETKIAEKMLLFNSDLSYKVYMGRLW